MGYGPNIVLMERGGEEREHEEEGTEMREWMKRKQSQRRSTPDTAQDGQILYGI